MTRVLRFGARHLCRRPALAAAVAMLVLGTHPVLADDAVKAPPAAAPVNQPAPLDLVKSSVSRALAIVRSEPDGASRRAEIRQVAETLFDFNEMARRTLAQHWSQRSLKEQEEFVRLFADLLERSYLTTIGTNRLVTVTFQGESVDGSSARVRSRVVTERGAEIPMEYRLLQSGGRWAVYDVLVEGVSLISSYRSQFNSIIRTSSFEALLDRLRNREPRLISGRTAGP